MTTPQETPSGFAVHGIEFLQAAELVLNRATGASLPAYFLLGRSIELFLKAFLLHQGMTPKELASKKRFGHNLTALMREANNRQLTDHLTLDGIETGALDLLSAEYCGTRLGYRITGATYYLPLIDVIEGIARKLAGTLPPLFSAGKVNIDL